MSSREELDIQSDFIDLLTHNSCVLQVRRLPKQRRSRIEHFLTLFNQAWVMEEKYILDPQEVPKGFEDIAEYLQRLLKEEEMRAKLHGEEKVGEKFAQQKAENAYYKRKASEAIAREGEERRQKEMAFEQLLEGQVKLARLLLRTGMPIKDTALEAQLSEEEVSALTE